jgi:hypothetical protein
VAELDPAARPAAPAVTNHIKRTLLSLILFAIAFGYLEAAVVVYLRILSEPIREGTGLPIGNIFPLTPVAQLGSYLRVVKIELVREASTLIMLAMVALTAASGFRTWLAAFSLVFGMWDLAFYASLKILVDWPQTLFTWDLLFLLPVPWSAPVLAPVIVAASLVIGGGLGLWREPPRVGWIPWALLVSGGAILLVSFMWDWRNISSGGAPHPFAWGIFAAGELMGVIGLAAAIRVR